MLEALYIQLFTTVCLEYVIISCGSNKILSVLFNIGLEVNLYNIILYLRTTEEFDVNDSCQSQKLCIISEMLVNIPIDLSKAPRKALHQYLMQFFATSFNL